MGVSLHATSCFSLAAFIIFSLSLDFDILIIRCLGVSIFRLILLGTLHDTLNWMFASFSRLGKFSVISSGKFSVRFVLSSTGNSII